MAVAAQVVVSGLLLGSVYVLISIGLTLIFGVIKIVNFAHGAFLMVSMYLTFWSFQLLGLSPYVSLFLVAPLMFLVGLAVYELVIKRTVGRSHDVQIFATVAIALLLENAALYLWSPNFRTVQSGIGSTTLDFLGLRVSAGLVIAFAVATAITLILVLFLKYTYTGKAIRAASQDGYAATLMGISQHRVFAVTFGIGIATVGVAGALLMPVYAVFPTIGTQLVLIAFVVVVLGGLGSMTGAMVGGLVVGLVETLSGYFIDLSVKQLAYFVVLILVLIIRPWGIFGVEGAERSETS